MKLNNKRTILVGLAFLSICAFWQMYDSVVPLILTKTFHMNETFSGAIMAADNILALFLLPFFSAFRNYCGSPVPESQSGSDGFLPWSMQPQSRRHSPVSH